MSEISKVKNLLVSLKIQIPHTLIPSKYACTMKGELENWENIACNV